MTRTDIFTAYVVLRALGYLLPERWDNGRWDPWMNDQLRQFQAAANREQGKRLAVDGVLGDDTLNALAWYGTRPPANRNVRGDGLPAGEWAAVSRNLLARQNRPWGLGPARAPTPRPTPQPTQPTPTPAPAPEPTRQPAPSDLDYPGRLPPPQPGPTPALDVTLEVRPETGLAPRAVDGVLVPLPQKPAEGLSTGAKVALGVGVGVLVLGGVALAVKAARARRERQVEGFQ